MKNTGTRKIIWVEVIKAVAILWIFFNHVSERLFGYPLISNPGLGWPSLAERISQLLPLNGFGLWNFPVNFLRYMGWFGDQGVQLFIIASGFGLTWGLLNRQAGQPLKVFPFYLKRAERIFPLWWGAHLLFIGLWLFTGWGLSAFAPATWISFLGLRVTPGLLYYFSPAWWYFWLLVQLYLVYPLLWNGLRKWGPLHLLLWSSLAAFLLRGIGMFYFDSYLDAWSRGAIFITRLPEFVFGMSLAAWTFLYPAETKRRLSLWWVWLLGILAYITGLYLALTLFGMIFSPFLLGVSAFLLLYLLINKLLPFFPRWLSISSEWLGEHSYSLYLVHHPVILALIPFGAAVSIGTVGRIGLAFILMIVLALALEWGVNFAITSLRWLWKRLGIAGLVIVSGLLGLAMILLLVGSELLIRRLDPQEILGWGERSSLEPDPQLGWKLIPSQTTHLRWLGYDYTVESNSLGFPGAEYPVRKSADTFRILVTGDAYSSAEGVDTNQAWPRLLENQVDKGLKDKKVEVMNFAITGYGPNQYADVIDKYVPTYKPDLIIVEMFVNDFFDVQTSNQQFQDSIGFGKPDQNGLYSIIKLEHLRRFLRIRVAEPLAEILLNKPNATGLFLGNFASFEKELESQIASGSEQISERLQQIQNTAKDNNSKLVLVMVPASIQVCNPSQLEYFPKGVNFGNTDEFDPELPQKSFSTIAGGLDITLLDLREAFHNTQDCPYQTQNMHWTSQGHQMVANYLMSTLEEKGYIP